MQKTAEQIADVILYKIAKEKEKKEMGRGARAAIGATAGGTAGGAAGGAAGFRSFVKRLSKSRKFQEAAKAKVPAKEFLQKASPRYVKALKGMAKSRIGRGGLLGSAIGTGAGAAIGALTGGKKKKD